MFCLSHETHCGFPSAVSHPTPHLVGVNTMKESAAAGRDPGKQVGGPEASTVGTVGFVRRRAHKSLPARTQRRKLSQSEGEI